MPLTYKYVFSPKESESDSFDVDFLCHDHKVHVRLREYRKTEVLRGFEAKLTYLVTYLFNYSFRPKFVGQPSPEALLKGFNTKSDTLLELSEAIRPYMPNQFRGIKVAAGYRRKTNAAFGFLDPETCPSSKEGQLVTTTGLQFFLSTFHTNVVDYLFNDAYEVVLMVDKKKPLYTKFKKKQERKDSRKQTVEVPLW